MPAPRKILLIDDEPMQYACVREMVAHFRTEAFEVDWTPTFNAGLRALLSGRYCACLLDYNLGPHNGLELLSESTRRHCITPVIMLTGVAHGDIDMKALQAGAVDYLDKTEISVRNLERCIRYALKLSESMEALRSLATQDPLTGLLNRRELDRLLEEELARAARFRRGFAVVLLDIDHFKRVNDTHGHQAGDLVLTHLARILGTLARSTDRVARFGGEEFAIVELENDEEGACRSAERIRQTLAEQPCPVPGIEGGLRITVSAGVAVYPNHGDGVDSLLRSADRALYAAKAAGRDRVVRASEVAD